MNFCPNRREGENEKKMSRWRNWKEKLDDLLDRLKAKLDRAKTRNVISSRKALKEQIHDAKVSQVLALFILVIIDKFNSLNIIDKSVFIIRRAKKSSIVQNLKSRRHLSMRKIL
jgi:hypothetical protein